jgi:hypothetical protein
MGIDSELLLIGKKDDNTKVLTDPLCLANEFMEAVNKFNTRQMIIALYAYDISPPSSLVDVALRYVFKVNDHGVPYPAEEGGTNYTIAPLRLLDIDSEIHRAFIRNVFLFVEAGGLHDIIKKGSKFSGAPDITYMYDLNHIMSEKGFHGQPIYTTVRFTPVRFTPLNCFTGSNTADVLPAMQIFDEKQNSLFLEKYSLAVAHMPTTDLGIQFLEFARNNPAMPKCTTFLLPRDNVPATESLNTANSQAASLFQRYSANTQRIKMVK